MYRLFKNGVDIAALNKIKETLKDTHKQSIHMYGFGKNSGVFPVNRDLSTFYPVECAQLLDSLFPGIDDPVLRSGTFAVYFTYAAPDTSVPIAKNVVRQCSIDFDLQGFAGASVEFLKSKSGSNEVSITADDAEALGAVTFTDTSVYLMDSTVYQTVPAAQLADQHRFRISYGWYSQDPEVSYDAIVAKLEQHGLLV